LVRHHDYTLAIAEAVSGKPFSRYWLHGGHLLVNGKKMSKSTGNVVYTSDILARGFTGDQLRFFLIYEHYKRKLNFTFERLAETSQKLNSLKNMIKELQATHVNGSNHDVNALVNGVVLDFENAMNNDLDVKAAFNSLYETIGELYRMRESLSVKDSKNLLNGLSRIDSVLQCIF
jgi:cysteinyl-tRNA synthetase